VSLRRVHEIFDAPVDVVEAPAAAALPEVRGNVELDGVTFTFGRGAPVLDNVALTIAAGERVAIVGRSGEGKSTIADLIVRQLDPASGRILLDGHDLRQLRLSDVRRHVVVVDQEPFVFNTSVLENLRYARPTATEAEAIDAVNAAGLGELVARMPDGIHTSVGERGRALSAGERQRLAVARALLADPAVLVLDEATGSLDPATEAYVVAGYEAAMRGRTTIMITHRIELARRADRVVVLDRGRIVEEGTVESLLARDAAFADLFSAVPAD
jgi:ATP-binding cassette subfamily B protein